jgi:hypothetical protein
MTQMPSLNEPERYDFAMNLIIEAGDLALQYFASGYLETRSEPVPGSGLYSSHSVTKRGFAWMCTAS